ncbi:hypothetical protein ACFB49_10950 [Sphingomonas sp. DBB INV C78]|uniref:hypothetical protein n=1 Tax=Sphingomonas sp. DBB INV C78 TaxID=3349434 RepID=UPI0036D267EA
MSWTDFIKPSAAVAALVIATCGVGASAATLVVRSSGPSAKAYPAGKQLADNGQIALKAGDQVVILDSKGTRTLKGPGTFSPTVSSNQASDSRETFAQVSSRRARPGATRGIPPQATAVAPASTDAARSPNIWFVDVERSATVCVADPAAVTLWRPEGGAAGTATLTNVGTGKAGTVQWTQGQSKAPWPASLPVSEGARYKVSWAGQAAPTELRFALLGAETAGLEDMASKLITKGCTAQLDMLIEMVAIPDSPAS